LESERHSRPAQVSVHRIYISPTLINNTVPRYNSRGPLFDAKYQGRVIVVGSTEPGLDSARVLKGMGLTGRLEVWDHVLPYWRFRLEIDKAAGLTIQEGEGRPIYRKFKPFAGHTVLGGVSVLKERQIAPESKQPPEEPPPELAGMKAEDNC
jgi:hypothetical protein